VIESVSFFSPTNLPDFPEVSSDIDRLVKPRPASDHNAVGAPTEARALDTWRPWCRSVDGSTRAGKEEPLLLRTFRRTSSRPPLGNAPGRVSSPNHAARLSAVRRTRCSTVHHPGGYATEHLRRGQRCTSGVISDGRSGDDYSRRAAARDCMHGNRLLRSSMRRLPSATVTAFGR